MLIEEIKLNDNIGCVEIHKSDDHYVIFRKNNRNKIVNKVDHIQLFDENNNCKLVKITSQILETIKSRMIKTENYSSAFVFFENEFEPTDDKYTRQTKSTEEHVYTSTGIKFWRHQTQMLNYKSGNPNTVISTHISPEGSCNLKCPYCSVTYRNNKNRISLDVIYDYVTKLKSRGLKSVILTGGGEPTVYKQFNELVRWIKDQNLSVALISNGTNADRVDDDVWKLFSWIRISVNLFNGWEDKITIPIELLDDKCVVGLSHVFTVEHEQVIGGPVVDHFNKISSLADRLRAQYIRILPNCLLEQDVLINVHRGLDKLFLELKDCRFFHQYKFHSPPTSRICHQSYFRPYLSEEIYEPTGEPGTVYPCDSVVLNRSATHFDSKYQLCSAENILDYIDRKINHKFTPCNDCSGCVFTDNVDMISEFVDGKLDRFDQYSKPMIHEEFV
jgi:hypothetical protein